MERIILENLEVMRTKTKQRKQITTLSRNTRGNLPGTLSRALAGLLTMVAAGNSLAVETRSPSEVPATSMATATADTAAVTDRLIVKYKNVPGASASAMAAQRMSDTAVSRLSRNAGAKLKHMRRLATGAQLLRLEKGANARDLGAIMQRLRQDPEIEYVEPDLLLKPQTVPTDPRYNEQWHYFEPTAGLNLPDAWDTTQGEGVVVAVIDTGYRPHPDLLDNLLPGYDMISDSTIAQDGDGRDGDALDPGDWAPAGACGEGEPESGSSWHGTHVAGTVAAATNNGAGIAGVAYKAKVVPIRVLGRCGGYTSDIADAMIWGAGGAVAGVPANANPAQVLNLSLGGGGSCGNTTQNAINTARSLGATVVVAAGNSNTNASNANPANCDGVVTVASVDRSGGRAWYSNYGDVVDVAAPGGDTSVSSNGVLSTLNSGSQGPESDNYAFYQGTSMATPHVAGAAALLYSLDPAITPDEVESVLASTARSFPATCNQCGTGIVDASAAVAAVNGGGTDPLPGDDALYNGVAVDNLQAVQGTELQFTMEVPAGASDLQFETYGGSGDADLYVRFGSAPTTQAYDCRPYRTGNSETCTFATPQAGTYHVMLRAYNSFSGVSLVGSFQENSGSGASSVVESDLSGAAGSWQHFPLEVAAGSSTLDVQMSGGSGDADLYVNFGSQPTTQDYVCRPYRNGNSETCSIDNPQAGTWYISVQGYSDYSGVSLDAQATP
ncbi:S8 family peptidase [Microbulbifer sp. YPW16]|uniref:S8 family peptidase n=1 Tax=Microbulbifer sp. YPW16 TaxID=2904242 RepID=UPI00272E1A64|nr:S8 family peptidase [Microbulbifer sp. YPW16]